MSDDRNWKSTLNLPETTFPMRANLPQREPQILAEWQSQGLYRRIIEARKGRPAFVFHDGPPYANGHIHHGHILNKILKDIVVKHRNMSGYCCEFIPGWDCHGLPIEHEVDKKLGKKKRDMSQIDIRNACRDYALRFVDIQKVEFERLGVLADWDNPYTTLDKYYESTVVRELGRLAERGMVAQDLKPVHWSYAAATALAEAEVEYKPFTAPSIYVRFGFPDPPSIIKDAAGGRQVNVVIWTTTPWTLPANLAIALHPQFEYQLVALSEIEAIVVAEGLADQVFEACGLDNTRVLASFKGSDLVGTADAPLRPVARHPFIDRESVLLPADYVTLEQGTGCVHTAPGHGQEDYVLGREMGLDILSPVDFRGRFTDDVKDFAGLHVFVANPQIVAMLDEIGALLSPPELSVKIDRYPHCWRTKKPVIFRATEQWFIRVDETGLRDQSLKAITETNWIPTWGEDRIRGMLENRPDWCVSRQRIWGVPIPALRCTACNDVFLRHEVAFHLADLAEDEGVDAWFKRPVDELVPEGVRCRCGAGVDQFERSKDILDVWFESGASFAAVLGSREGLDPPIADLYLEGSDQHRGWFQSSLLVGIGSHDHAPFKAVLTHGFVLDEAGHKYSKSSKNFEKPDKIIKTLGAEILRLWVAAVDYRGDMNFSGEILKRISDAYRRIRNTARFLLGNLADFDPNTQSLDPEALPPLDRWALDNLAVLVRKLRSAYLDYEFHTVFHRLLEYCTVDLSQNYFDVLKDRLYLELPDDPRRRASQTVLYEILRHLVLLSAPILSFTSEEIWKTMPHRSGDPDSVHLCDFPDDPPAEWDAPNVRAAFEELHKIRARVQEAIEARRPKSKGERLPGQIGSSQEASVCLTAEGSLKDSLLEQTALLEELFIVSHVTIEEGPADDGQAAVAVAVELASGEKCPRCWNYRIDFGFDGQYDELCRRCARVVSTLDSIVA
jgi:isoleucyl-tRNA synthetase